MPVSIETLGHYWRDLRDQFLNLLYPPRCVGCRRIGVSLCAECIEQFPRVEPPFCARCGDQVVAEGLCTRCRTSPLQIERIRAVVYFEGVLREALHQLKYQGRTALAEPLGGLMAAYWVQHALSADIVVPVPLHAARLRERGYNQAALLARAMTRRIGLALDEQTLVRERATAPQVDLDASQRKENVRGAFRCSARTLTGRRVLLVDDVCTTGATLEACAIALYEGGASSVQALTLARTR